MKNKILYAAIMVLVAGTLLLPLASNAITLSPPMLEYKAKAGDIINDVITIRNENKTAEQYTITTEAFEAAGKGGEPKFLGTNDAGLASWIAFGTDKITVNSGEAVQVPIKITIPTDTVGGHYAAIFFNLVPPQMTGNTSGVGIGSRVGTLVFVQIEGQVTESAKIANFSTKSDNYSSLPVDFNVEVNNDGNVYIRPAGKIYVKNMFGSLAGEMTINEDKAAVLQKQTRQFTAQWVKNPNETKANTFWGKYRQEKENYAFGKYTAELAMQYGESNKIVRAKTMFWVIPWHIILVNLICIVIVVILIYVLVKQYNAWLIRKFQKVQKKVSKTVVKK
jgi:hypothetical protein